MNLFNHWYKISIQQEILIQRDSYDTCVNGEDIVGCEWKSELFVNSCDGALIKSIEEKYYNLDELEQGGITCRNLLSIDSRLNRIDLSPNTFPPNPERGYKTKFEILLE